MTTAPQVSLTPDRIALRPGTSAEVEVTVHNASQLVEHYTTAIVGLPRDELYDCEPDVVKLRPGEAGTVRVRISLPERAGPRAGTYILGVLVHASSQRAASRCEELPLEVLPASTLSMAVQPEVAVGGSSATYTVRVTNEGNMSLAVDLAGSDPEGKVSFSFTPRSLQVEPGSSAQTHLTVWALAPWTGQELRRSLALYAAAGPDLTAETPATFVQRPRVAGGLLRTAGVASGVAVLAAATVGGALLVRNTRHDSAALPDAAASQSPSQPSPTSAAPITSGASSTPSSTPSSQVASVPKVVGQTKEAAIKMIANANLSVTFSTAPSNTVATDVVIDQLPAPDTPLPPGAQVTATVSTGKHQPLVLMDHASEASWRSGAGALSFPGAETNQQGFVLLWPANSSKLEDGGAPRYLETHPQWVDQGWINGDFALPDPIIAGDHFRATIGFMAVASPPSAGEGDFVVLAIAQDGTTTELSRTHDIASDGRLIPLDVDLTPAQGATTIRLRVEAGTTSAQDWAVWVDPRVEG